MYNNVEIGYIECFGIFNILFNFELQKELSLSNTRRPSAATARHRKSMIVQTSPTLPRCHSPGANVSPLDSPKVRIEFHGKINNIMIHNTIT